jgi:hypothetical protein
MKRKLFGVALAALSLAGCGGGGSGGGGPAGDPMPQTLGFTSFSAVQPNQTVAMSGMSQTVNGNNTATAVTSATFGGVDTASTSVQLTYDAAKTLSGIAVASSDASISFSKGAGDSISCSSGSCLASDATGNRTVVMADAQVRGWNYQTFGIWANAPIGPYQSNAFSVGNATPGTAVPLTGNASFTGLALGLYIDASGTVFATAANMSANVNFSARSIGFATSSTTVQNVTTGTVASNTGLNLAGNLAYGAGSSQFSGSVVTSNGALSGSTAGQFYGPAAEELGGIYSLSGSGTMRMLGAYGGKR